MTIFWIEDYPASTSMPDYLEQLKPVLFLSSIPGGFGGLASFLYGLKRGHFKNNKYIAKAVLEIVGGLVVASFVVFGPKILVGFIIGLCWSTVIQVIRGRITVIVEAFLSKSTKGPIDAD